MTILEGNTLIEEFMYPNEIIDKYRADTLVYHASWNKLMEVVIAIEEKGGDENELYIFGNCVQLDDKEFVGKTKLEAVWKAVVYWVYWCSQHST